MIVIHTTFGFETIKGILIKEGFLFNIISNNHRLYQQNTEYINTEVRFKY